MQQMTHFRFLSRSVISLLAILTLVGCGLADALRVSKLVPSSLTCARLAVSRIPCLTSQIPFASILELTTGACS